MNLRERTLQIAVSKEGVHEVGGDNRGPEVEAFQRAAKIRPGDPWCAAFVNWCAEQAAKEMGVASPLEGVPLQGSVQSYVDHGKKHGWVVDARHIMPGDLFCIYFPTKARYAHIGFVKSVASPYTHFRSCEGNSNDEGSREGKEVCSNLRAINPASILFLRWSGIIEQDKAA